MANWFHRFFNPHCPNCAEEEALKKTCFSCDSLRLEVSRLSQQNAMLINKLTERPEVESERSEAPLPTAVLPKRVPWAVKQQQLEMKDREKAQEMKLRANAPKTDVTELERELDTVSSEREAKSAT